MSSLMFVIIFIVILASILIVISRICMCVEKCSMQKHFSEYLENCRGSSLEESIQKVNTALKAFNNAVKNSSDKEE